MPCTDSADFIFALEKLLQRSCQRFNCSGRRLLHKHVAGIPIFERIYDEIYSIIVNGDGTSPGATNVFSGSAGTWAYTDMVHLAMSFDVPSQMTHVLGTKADIEKILNLSQYQDPDTWHAAQLFSQQGRYQGLLPMNAKLVVAPNATATKFAALDKRFAIRESVAQPLMIEAEKIITQKLESAVISKESVYTIMVDEAIKTSDY